MTLLCWVGLEELLGGDPESCSIPLCLLPSSYETTLTALSSLENPGYGAAEGHHLPCKPLSSPACTLLSMRMLCMDTGILWRLLVPSCWLSSHHTPAFPPMGLALPLCSLSAGAGAGERRLGSAANDCRPEEGLSELSPELFALTVIDEPLMSLMG